VQHDTDLDGVMPAPARAQRRLAKWRHHPDGRVDAYLGPNRVLILAATACLVGVSGLHVAATRITFGPWLWLCVALDVGAIAWMLRRAALQPSYLTIERKEISARVGLGRLAWRTASIRSIELGERLHFIAGGKYVRSRIEAAPCADITGDDGAIRIELRDMAERDALLRALAHVTDVTPTVSPEVFGAPEPTRRTLASAYPSSGVGRQLAFSLAVAGYLIVAVFGAMALLIPRTPEERTATAADVIAEVRTASSALDAGVRDRPTVETAVERCTADLAIMRTDPEAWTISARSVRSSSDGPTAIDWWRDSVNDTLGTTGFTTQRNGLRLSMPSSAASRVVELEAECVVGTEAERAEISTGLTALAADIVGVAAAPRTLTDFTSELRVDVTTIPGTIVGDARVDATAEVEECEESTAVRIDARAVRTVPDTFPMSVYNGVVGELFEVDSIVMRSVPGFRGDGYFVSIDLVDGELSAHVATTCAVGTEAEQADTLAAASDLAERLVQIELPPA
jgi:hypothetical protein